jgi:hypothetical protein
LLRDDANGNGQRKVRHAIRTSGSDRNEPSETSPAKGRRMRTALKKTGWVSLALLLSATPLWAQSAAMPPAAYAAPSAGNPGYYANTMAQTAQPAAYNQAPAYSQPAPMSPDGQIAFQQPMGRPTGGDPGNFGQPLGSAPGYPTQSITGPPVPGPVYPQPQTFWPPNGYGADPATIPTLPGGPVGGELTPWTPPYADKCPLVGLSFFQGYDSWRDLANGDFSNNNGFSQGINVGAPLPGLAQFGCGMQIGGSYGLYNLSGKSGPSVTNEVSQQWFITGGFYRRADFDRRLSGGVVYDLMSNDSFGVFNANPKLGQFRAQLACALGYFNEIGVWGAVHSFNSLNQGANGAGEVYFRAVDQINLFWHHKYGLGGADSWLWVGSPDHVRFTDPVFGGGGSLADLIVGGALNVPVHEKFAVYGNFMYMKPTASPGAGAFASIEDSWNISFGLQFFPGATARSSTVAGRVSSPLLPVANNGTFIVNTNRTL